MGVRGLQTYLEKYCPQACYEVKISDIVKEYKTKSEKEAVIVVDAQSCYCLWYDGMDWMTGFEIQEYIHRLRIFVDEFRKIGAKLVFFFGGLTPEKKRKSWIQRRRRNLQDIHDVFDMLYNGLRKEFPKTFNSIPPNMGITTSFVLKYVLGCEVLMSVEECDEEIISYVVQNDCFAILAQDTDFIISDLNAVVLSSRKLDLSKMTTLLYDRHKLSRKLDISVKQLPLLSILAGNDLIPFPTISAFHHYLIGGNWTDKNVPFDVLMEKLGAFIKKLPDKPLDEMFKIIAQDMYRSTDSDKIELMHLSYSGYIAKPIPERVVPTDEWSRILYRAKYRHKYLQTPALVYSILSEQTFEISTAFEDLRKIHYRNSEVYRLPSSTVTRSLRQRLYGILLHEKKGPPIKVREWCGEHRESYWEADLVEPLKPTAHHPGLILLWSDSNSDRNVDLRWDLFVKSISPCMRAIDWKTYSEKLLLSTLSVIYLFRENYLNSKEVDAVLITLAVYPLYSNERLSKVKYDELDFRAAHISVSIIRTFGLVLTLLSACGYPVEISEDIAYLKFEGKLFQIKYKDCLKNRMRYNELCENNDECLKTFYMMKNKIYRDQPRTNNCQQQRRYGNNDFGGRPSYRVSVPRNFASSSDNSINKTSTL